LVFWTNDAASLEARMRPGDYGFPLIFCFPPSSGPLQRFSAPTLDSFRCVPSFHSLYSPLWEKKNPVLILEWLSSRGQCLLFSPRPDHAERVGQLLALLSPPWFLSKPSLTSRRVPPERPSGFSLDPSLPVFIEVSRPLFVILPCSWPPFPRPFPFGPSNS